jgi:predicted 3-demethylubiquinone-9 3-methyltransferase (glyoxalase superfamily)
VGGKALMDINTYPWSKRYGWLQDKFGFTWQIAVVYNAGDEPKMTPSLLFTKSRFGQAEAAINFYTTLFPNSSISQLMRYAPEDANAGNVLYSEFKLNGQDVIAMDGPGQHEYEFNEAVSFVIECKDQNEIDFFWNAFLQHGTESMCGWICDQFGVWWQVVPKNLGQYMTDADRAQRVMQALLKMKKLDIETLANA